MEGLVVVEGAPLAIVDIPGKQSWPPRNHQVSHSDRSGTRYAAANENRNVGATVTPPSRLRRVLERETPRPNQFRAT